VEARAPESPVPPTPKSGEVQAAPRAELAENKPDASPAAPENTTARLADVKAEPEQSEREEARSQPHIAVKSQAPEKPVVVTRSPSPSSPLRIAAITLGAAALSYGVVRFGISPQLTGTKPTASESAAASPTEAHTAAVQAASSPDAVRAPASAAAIVQAAAAAAPTTQDLPMPPGVVIAHAKGLLEIDTSDQQAIYVDGVFVGRGPLRRIPLDPGSHQVELRDGSANSGFSVAIKQGRRARVSVPGDEKPGAPR
jgi:hypothetical protein